MALMNDIDITESKALALDAAVQALEQIGLERPLRWVRRVSFSPIRPDQQYTDVYILFWLWNDSTLNYMMRVQIAKVKSQTFLLPDSWHVMWAQGHPLNDSKICNWRFKNDEVLDHSGVFPFHHLVNK